MRSIFEHIERVQAKPYHIRKRVAFSVAGAGTALVALVWLIGSLALGDFAIAGSSFADSVGQGNIIATVPSDSSLIAGAGAVVSDSAKENAPRIQIIDTTSSVKGAVKTEPTILPF